MPVNYFNPDPNQEVEEDFKDQPPEMTGEEPMDIPEPVATRPQRPTTQTVQLPQHNEPEYKDDVGESDDDIEADTDILTDARLRLEQGRLYELVLNHNLFEGVDADPKAIKSVQREIRAYAQERMEIMLGMRQEKSQELANAFPMDQFPFNSLEVEALKAVAAAATKGASRDAAPLEIGPGQPATRKSLNPIAGKPVYREMKRANAPSQKPLPSKPSAPVKRAKPDYNVQRILEEEGVTLEQVNQVFDPHKKYLTPEEFASLTDDQVIERNRVISARNKQVQNPAALPMPTQEQIEAVAMARAAQAAANPQMQKIMGLLDDAQKKKGT